jgi:hypothetical protein
MINRNEIDTYTKTIGSVASHGYMDRGVGNKEARRMTRYYQEAQQYESTAASRRNSEIRDAVTETQQTQSSRADLERKAQRPKEAGKGDIVDVFA